MSTIDDMMMGLEQVPSDRGKWLIHGPNGTGKSTLSSTIAGVGPTLFLDLPGEKGVRSFQGAPYEKNIRVIRPKTIQDVAQIYDYLYSGSHPFKAVVLDSLTSIQKLTMRFVLGDEADTIGEISGKNKPPTMQDWGHALRIMEQIITFYYGLADTTCPSPMQVVMTAQTKIIEDKTIEEMSRIPDVQKGAVNSALGCPDYILYTDLEDNAQAFGDDRQPKKTFIVHFGADTAYRTKARVPVELQGKIPHILGRDTTVDLVMLSRILGIGGIPPKNK